MKLADTFEAVAYKQLVASDLPNRRSHQHELTGVKSLNTIFGPSSKIEGRLTWVFFADGEEPANEENDFTFYDARAKTAARTGRSEWRLYYQGNFLDHAFPMLKLLLVLRPGGHRTQDSLWLPRTEVRNGDHSPITSCGRKFFEATPDPTRCRPSRDFDRSIFSREHSSSGDRIRRRRQRRPEMGAGRVYRRPARR
jgi:hypothetical protein